MLRRPSVEYNLTDHCNLSCTACARGSPLLADKLTDLDAFATEVRELAAAMHCDELRIGGGEPLLHPKLLEFLRVAGESGLADEVVLITNGVLLHQAPEQLWELIDGMWLSLYPGVKLRISLDECRRLAERHAVRLSVRQADEFSLILLNQRNEDAEAVDLVYRSCKAAREWSCHTIHEGRFYKCSTAPFTEARVARLGGRFEENSRDFVRLDDASLPSALASYLADERPLAACAWCLGSNGPSLPNRQLNKQALAASEHEDHRLATALVGRALKAERDREELLGRLERAEGELGGVYESWSWRLTAPVRSLLRALKRIAGSGGE
jgi:MoaA/NifB/PqqE/SkfB family radical SAM enzyme